LRGKKEMSDINLAYLKASMNKKLQELIIRNGQMDQPLISQI